MGYVKETFLYCDICHESYADNRTEGLSAKELRAHSDWHRIKGKDVCWQCYESGKHKENSDD